MDSARPARHDIAMNRLTDLDPNAVARQLGQIAVEAGRGLAAISDRRVGQHLKDDGSLCSAADLESERLIVQRLRAAFPDIPIVAEEAGAELHGNALFFLVDPLDGTRDYLTGVGEYSVNIALVSGERPIAAAVAAPASNRVWIAGTTALVGAVPETGDAITWSEARVRAAPAGGLVALVSRRHGDPKTEAVLEALPVAERQTASSAYKFCLIASGEADLYVRCGPTMEWDTAAGDHVVAIAGGVTIGPDRKPLTYGHRNRRYLNGPFAVLGQPALAADVVLPQP
jgi:3'(2'), 5'-bisphosphate nucleotidase